MITYGQATAHDVSEFWHMTAKNANGTPVRARRTGKTQTWKTRPSEFKIPVKYGLRQSFYITDKTAHEWCTARNWPVESELFRGGAAMKYADLSADAKSKARDWYRSQIGTDDWWESTYEDAATVADMLGFDVAQYPKNGRRPNYTFGFSGFYSQGDGASFSADWSAERVDVAALFDYAPKDEDLRQLGAQAMAIVLRYPQSLAYVRVLHGRHLHSGTMFVDDPQICPDSGDEDTTEEQFIDLEVSLTEVARGLADWLYARLEGAYDYLTSDETIDNDIYDFDFDFDEDGQLA